MISQNDITFVIPIFNLKQHRINNLRFVLSKLSLFDCRILVVEQTKEKSTLDFNVELFTNVEHLLYKNDIKLIHKTGIINWAVKNHVKTKYVWVNDTDFYMKFSEAINNLPETKFIQPYSVGKKINESDSNMIMKGERIEVSYDSDGEEYISLYSALSFIFDASVFISIGGMDETIFGWGREDIEFSDRVSSKFSIEKLGYKGIHLWHPVEHIATPSAISENDMAVITCHFNWCNFSNPARNLHRFIRRMKIDGIPLYGIELSLTDRFETVGLDGWKQITVKKQNVCFQKEACLNLAEELVPIEYKKIAWIDPDLEFNNKNWYRDTSKKLNSYKLVQMYSMGLSTDKYGREQRLHPGIMSMYGKVSESDWFNHPGHPGGAWGARRELWKFAGLYPFALMGGGDTVFIYTIFGYDFSHTAYKNIGISGNRIFQHYSKWRNDIQNYVNKNVSFIDGDFIHEWHGNKPRRNYNGRHEILKKIDMNKNVRLNSDGLVEIHSLDTDCLTQEIFSYFKNRDEDGLMEEFEKYIEYKINEK